MVKAARSEAEVAQLVAVSLSVAVAVARVHVELALRGARGVGCDHESVWVVQHLRRRAAEAHLPGQHRTWLG